MTILILLLVVGYILVIAEMILPGGVLGILGVLCLIGAAVWAFVEFDPTTGFFIVLAEAISGVILISIWMKYFFDSRYGKHLVLSNEKTADEPDESTTSRNQELLNLTGTALTYLRPSGTATINGKRYDVLAEGNLIDRGETIKVVKVDGTHIFVRREISTEPTKSNQ
jgi:membrane-bound serine protease (ClpP class)